jgi:hypothetical protein
MEGWQCNDIDWVWKPENAKMVVLRTQWSGSFVSGYDCACVGRQSAVSQRSEITAAKIRFRVRAHQLSRTCDSQVYARY